MKYILVFILSCVSLAHDAKPMATDPPLNFIPNSKQITITPELRTDSASPNPGNNSEKEFKVSETVTKFMATIREIPSDLYLCSATFIKKDALLTTARCLFGRDVESLSVHSNSSSLETEGPGNIAINNVYLHPEFDMNPVRMDFALITLKEAVDYITPMSLPHKKLGRQGVFGTAYNWRFTTNTNKFLIHEHQCKIISNSKCFLLEREIIPDGMVCAKGLPHKEGHYDHGMPFIINKKGKSYLFGISRVIHKVMTEKVEKIWKIYEIVPWIRIMLKENNMRGKKTPEDQRMLANSDDFSHSYSEEEDLDEEENEDGYT